MSKFVGRANSIKSAFMSKFVGRANSILEYELGEQFCLRPLLLDFRPSELLEAMTATSNEEDGIFPNRPRNQTDDLKLAHARLVVANLRAPPVQQFNKVGNFITNIVNSNAVDRDRGAGGGGNINNMLKLNKEKLHRGIFFDLHPIA